MTTRPGFGEWARQDLEINRHALESQLVVLLFRSAQWIFAWCRPRWLARFLIRVYRAITYLVLHIELPPDLVVGPNLRIHHPHVIVLNPGTVIGRDCVLRHMVTIGNRSSTEGTSDCPVLGDDVDVGAGAMILGPIHVGDGARIGAGAVVVHDVPAGAVVTGPAAQVRPAPGLPDHRSEA